MARAIERQGGHDLESAIPIAVSRIKVWATGKGVNAKTQAKAAAAAAQWEKMKASSKAKSAGKSALKVAASEAVVHDLSVSADALLRLTVCVSGVYDGAVERVLSLTSKDPTSAHMRRLYARTGVAMPDGSFPIPNKDYLGRAIGSIGRTPAHKRPAVKSHIRKRARALSAADMIPDNWD